MLPFRRDWKRARTSRSRSPHRATAPGRCARRALYCPARAWRHARSALARPARGGVTALQETLGQKLTAFAVGIKDPKAIGKYATGRQPRADTEARLRDLYRVTRLLLSEETPSTVRAWMIGANPQLNDEAPIEALHERCTAPVMRAAEAFVLGG